LQGHLRKTHIQNRLLPLGFGDLWFGDLQAGLPHIPDGNQANQTSEHLAKVTVGPGETRKD